MHISMFIIFAVLTSLTAAESTIGLAQQVSANSEVFTLAPGFSTASYVGVGTSGGSRETPDCGFTSASDAPNLILNITAPFSYLRATVLAQGDVTLLVEGPNGRICSDDVNGLMPEIAGPVPVGTYNIWVGDYLEKPESGFPYQLTLTEVLEDSGI